MSGGGLNDGVLLAPRHDHHHQHRQHHHSRRGPAQRPADAQPARPMPSRLLPQPPNAPPVAEVQWIAWGIARDQLWAGRGRGRRSEFLSLCGGQGAGRYPKPAPPPGHSYASEPVGDGACPAENVAASGSSAATPTAAIGADAGAGASAGVEERWWADARLRNLHERPCTLTEVVVDVNTSGQISDADHFAQLPKKVFDMTPTGYRGHWQTLKHLSTHVNPQHLNPTAAVIINFKFAAEICRTPPARIDVPSAEGRLMYGTLDHRLSEPWLRQQKITHTINCLGKFLGRRGEQTHNPHWDILHAPEAIFPGVASLDWCFGNPQDRRNVDTFFQNIFNLLQRSTTVIYVHCKNGRDRSAGMVYAILRICFAYEHEAARAALQTRLDTAGNILHPKEEIMQAWRDFIEGNFTGF